MSVRKSIPYHGGIFFITFTCWKWMNLFQITNGYDAIYNWFDILKTQGHYVTGYVIMPNHFHGLLAFRNTPGTNINTLIGNGKRFLAYDIITRLKHLDARDVLNSLAKAVSKRNHKRTMLHRAFEPSFDWKECHSDKFIRQKLNYIHNNPCSGKWCLVENTWDYIHSSAQFYEWGIQGVYEVTNYNELRGMFPQRPRDGRRCGDM